MPHPRVPDPEPAAAEHVPQHTARAPEGKRLTPMEMGARDAEIVAAKMRGLTWSQIANTYGLTVRRCKQIHKAYRESNPTLRHHDPIDVVDELLEGYQGVIEELALISATTRNDAVRVGAINAKMTAYTRIMELLQSIGVLPNDLGQLRVEVDARFVADTVIRVLREYSVPEEVEAAMVAALEGRRPDLVEAA